MTAPDRPWKFASAPCSYGVDEVMLDDAWMPAPDDMLDWMVDAGYAGTELGPPGYLGDGPSVRERLGSRGLALVGSFLPQRLSRPECVEDDRAWLRATLRSLREATPPGPTPLAILSDGIDESARHAVAGRVSDHPETWLTPTRFATLVDNLHRAAEVCRAEGFDVVIHPHAGTYLESADEIARLMDRLDGSLLGLCLDTGHFRFGGADPARAVRDYHALVRHVHLKDCAVGVIDEVAAEGGGLEAMLVRGVFTGLGHGASGIDDVLEALRDHDYRGWLVVEQDQFLGPDDTPASVAAGQAANREYLRQRGF